MARALVPLAEGFEEVEALTVSDLLYRAGVRCDLIAVHGELVVSSSHELAVVCDLALDEADLDSYDMLILPGGQPGTNNLGACVALGEALVSFAERERPIAAICAAPTVFAKLGLLQGRRATCYPSLEGALIEGGASFVEEPVVRDGAITTSRGMGTAIPFALSLVEQLVDAETARRLSHEIVYS